MKSKSCILRLSEQDNTVLTTKASLMNTTKSALLRDGGMYYWNGSTDSNQPYDAEKLLKLYQSSDNKKLIVEIVFQYLRRHGYPHNVLDRSTLIKKMHTISNGKSPLLEDDHLQVNTTGLQVPNHFHNHMVKVKCLDRYISPQECFDDDDKLRDAIDRWMELGNKPTLAGIRRILRTRDKVRSVVNFKPVIAKYIYDKYCHSGDRHRLAKTLDPCAGFGGRLSGCIASREDIYYHGIDPCGDTAIGNMKMAAFYTSVYENDIEKARMFPFRFKFDLGCAEDVMPTLWEPYDLVFTSPPFFDVEKYDNGSPDQSFVRYPSYQEWLKKFLFPVLKQSYRVLRKHGKLVINVKNYDKMAIADDMRDYCEKLGFKLLKIYQMRLSNNEYHRKEGQDNWHTEPMFVFES